MMTLGKYFLAKDRKPRRIDMREHIKDTACVAVGYVAVEPAGDKAGVFRIPDAGITLEFINAESPG